MERKIRGEKGITLIALIITIVVLLILAVVAISAVTGDGIIEHATEAKTQYGAAQELEKLQLALNEWSLLKNIPSNQKTLAEFLNEKSSELNITVQADGKDAKMTTESGVSYKATEQGKLIKLIKFYVEYTGGETATFEYYAEEGMTWEQFVESSYNYLKIESTVYSFEINSEILIFNQTTGAGGFGGYVDNVKVDDKIQDNQRIIFEIL